MSSRHPPRGFVATMPGTQEELVLRWKFCSTPALQGGFRGVLVLAAIVARQGGWHFMRSSVPSSIPRPTRATVCVTQSAGFSSCLVDERGGGHAQAGSDVPTRLGAAPALARVLLLLLGYLAGSRACVCRPGCRIRPGRGGSARHLHLARLPCRWVGGWPRWVHAGPPAAGRLQQ